MPQAEPGSLVAFLRARLDKDEAVARRVKSSWRQVGETGVIVASDGGRAEECANGNWTGIAEHIVRHDPPRVLAEVESKRRIIELHALEYRERPERVLGEADDPFCAECSGEGFPCETLRLLALPYADHPDYREEWRP